VYVIKRVKTGPGISGTAATHYATALAEVGNATGWTKDRGKAVRVDDATALKVEDYYAAKLKAGQPVGLVTAEDDEPVDPPVTRPDTTDGE
jgi:hypothetical protein